MSRQLTNAIHTAGPEVTEGVAVWLYQCGQSAIGQTATGQAPAALLFAGLRAALLDHDDRGGDVHPTLVGATVSVRDADPGAMAEMPALLAEHYADGWALLLAALARELDLANTEGQRRAREAMDAVHALDGVPPEWSD